MKNVVVHVDDGNGKSCIRLKSSSRAYPADYKKDVNRCKEKGGKKDMKKKK